MALALSGVLLALIGNITLNPTYVQAFSIYFVITITVVAIMMVRPDGRISLPLIGDVQASGLSPTELTADI